MSLTITIDSAQLNTLDISAAQTKIEELLTDVTGNLDPQIAFELHVPKDDQDPRELSEIPEIRLWFIRLDAFYPWLPFWLNWKEGELARYTAMLVPHQFHPTAGIQFNPEALEIFLMQKLFTIHAWLKHHDLAGQEKLKGMSKLLGYELDDGLFRLL